MTEHAVSAIPREARPYQGQVAGLVTRVLSGVIDAGLVTALSLAGFVGWQATRFLADPRDFHFPDTSFVPATGVVMGVGVAYLAVTWAVLGRSYGGRVMGVRVVLRRLRRPGPVRSLVRAIACVVFPVGLVWCGVSPTRRSVQDLLVRTWVVYDWRPRPGPPPRTPDEPA